MGHLPRRLDANGQRPAQMLHPEITFRPEDQDQPDQPRQTGGKSHTHAQNHHDQHTGGHPKPKFDWFHQLVPPVKLFGLGAGLRCNILNHRHRHGAVQPQNQRAPVTPQLQKQTQAEH